MASEEGAQKSLLVSGVLGLQGLKAEWGLGNQLFVFPGKETIRGQASSASSHGEQAYIHEVLWNTDMHSPITRKLVNESHNIFKMLQGYQNDPDSTRKPQLIKFSRQYRSVLKACVMDLQSVREQLLDEFDKQDVYSQLQLFEMVELIWSLCEILFVETLPGGTVLLQLLDWIKWHFTRADEFCQTALQEKDPEVSSFYWDAVYCYVLQGRTDDARKLLSIHPQKQTDAFLSLDELLRKMPIYSSHHTLAEFDLKWKHWQEECIRRLEEGQYGHQKNLETVCRILCGDEQVFTDLRDLCESWYQMVISKMLYINPTVKAFDLQYHIQACIDAYGGNSHLDTLDNIILAAFEFDVHQVIKESSTHLSNWWFTAHITDLLHHAGQLDLQRLAFGSDLREFLLLEYASGLMSHESLWQVGSSYLDHCPEFGRHYLEHYIEHIPIRTEKTAQKVLRICEQRDLIDQAKSICKVMGMQALHNSRYGSALSWCLKSKDVTFATYISEKFLSDYSDRGDFSNLDIIDNLGPAMLLSNRLTFLGKYREFHKLYESGEFKSAASLLLSLLTAKLAPQRFWMTLLMDALPLLELDDLVIFNTQETYELMHVLEEIHIANKFQVSPSKDKPMEDSDNKSKANNEFDQEKMDLLKLALARNLARAIVHEGSTQS